MIDSSAAALPVIVSRIEGVTTDHIQKKSEGILISGHDPDDYADSFEEQVNEVPEVPQVEAVELLNATENGELQEGNTQLQEETTNNVGENQEEEAPTQQQEMRLQLQIVRQ